ncbi:MAG: envelope stress response membrane protein PspB [Gammaproteobacteria bacterium]|nr:envelope stress response membrane protein PspB [Gammaproteobacteria bacterium]
MSLTVLAFVPTLVFVSIVLPLWLILHYRSRRHAASELNADERYELEALADKAERFADRIEVLEAILDESVPNWRD